MFQRVCVLLLPVIVYFMASAFRSTTLVRHSPSPDKDYRVGLAPGGLERSPYARQRQKRERERERASEAKREG